MTDDAIKTQAEAIAAVVMCETSYVVREWFTDRFALIRLPGSVDSGLILNVACGCIDRNAGCLCDCAPCRENCEERDTPCINAWNCRAMEKSWSDADEPFMAKALALVANATTDGAPIELRKRKARSNPCVLDAAGQHVTGPDKFMSAAHVARHYVVAARRYAGVTSWRLGAHEGSRYPMLAGFAGEVLAALVMPMGGGVCQEAA